MVHVSLMPTQTNSGESRELRMGPFTHHPELDALAVLMFRQFSRFEYALKASGHLPDRDGSAEADWDGFARDVHLGLVSRLKVDPSLGEAVDYLMNFPPKKQVIRHRRLDWEDIPANCGTSTEALLVYVRRVRNNLFHGGKFSERWIDPERSERLIRASLEVLNACLRLSRRVRDAYQT